MLFNSLQYLIFLPLVVAAYWFVPRRVRPVVLLVSSYYFYMSWLKSYGFLLGGLTLLNFLLGLTIVRLSGSRWRRLALIAGLALNLGCLALYKYTNFLIDSFWQLWTGAASAMPALPGAPGLPPELPIVLPLGISFFVFEFIHYLTDVYKGGKPIGSIVRFGLFAAFFPSQIAGPIKRYQDFDHQLDELKRFDKTLAASGMWLILQGMFKKVVLGDNLALLVAPGFSNPASMGCLDAWVCVIAFALQIYYDFSGYTDIGRGSAMLFGFQLPENFNMPYIARNLSDFWRRWHISLSTWLRDYLYIPLGGSRGGTFSTARNLVLTMLLGGLWHGAAWHFVVWGGFHGLGLVATHWWQGATAKVAVFARLRKTSAWDIFGRLITFFLVLCGWVFFRAENIPQALAVFAAMFSLAPSPAPQGSVTALLIDSLVPAALTVYGAYYLGGRLAQRLVAQNQEKMPSPGSLAWWLTPPFAGRLVAYAAMSLVILGFASGKSMPFIYFQF